MKNLSTRNWWQRNWRRAVIAAVGALVIFCLLVVVRVRTKYRSEIYPVAQVPEEIYGVVLGASLHPGDNAPSDYLRDRLDTGIDLLRQRRVMGLIITGDDGKWKSNEIGAMYQYLLDKGVPADLLFIDGGAYRTFASCEHLRAKGFSHVVLITQNFHLPRALYLCNEVGVTATGVAADKKWYWSNLYFYGRDWTASLVGWFDVKGVHLINKG